MSTRTTTAVPPYSSYTPAASTLLAPLGTSFLLHGGLSLATYAVGYSLDRAEAKDWLWPSGMVANAWWQAVGMKMVHDGATMSEAFGTLSWREKLLLTGATAWGARLFYRIASRSVARGTDDPRYLSAKRSPSFWTSALLTQYLPEALFQTIITLPFTAPFRLEPVPTFMGSGSGYWGWWDSAAVGLFGMGFAMEVLADRQLAQKQKYPYASEGALQKSGVWSIVRHPNYLGDTLTQLSFPLILFATPLFHPLYLLGPFANYIFLRFIGGDADTEEYQESKYAKEDPAKLREFRAWKLEANSFWPGLNALTNSWSYIIVALGGATILLERAVRASLAPKIL